LALISLLPVISLIAIVCFIEVGSAFFFQKRVGKNKKNFTQIKFPTMKKEAPTMPTHLINANLITKSGKIMRRLKLDELPQFYNVLKGDMSIVGYRPCLPCQRELIEEREKRGVFNGLPGITGLAQVNNIDMSDPRQLARYDELMVKNLNVKSYFRFILMTIIGKGFGDRIDSKIKDRE